jgi:phosphoglycolate phosphatase
MSYDIYLFDFDYTLVDSETGITGTFHQTLQKLGYPDQPDAIIRPTIGMPMAEATARIINSQDPDEIEHFVTVYRHIADTFMTPHTYFYPDTLPILRTLKKNGAHIAVISSKTRHRIAEKFEQDQAAGFIDFIIGCEDVQAMKPSPEGILLALQRLQAEKSQAVYIGDSLFDAQAASNAGVDFKAVLTGVTPADAFKPWPHKAIMQHLAELIDA